MKILVACEYSGVLREELIALGHDVTSCDLKDSLIPSSRHYKGDVRDILFDFWDMIFTFPPCTHLATSGAKHFKEKQASGVQQQAIDFFMLFANHPCGKVVIENPVGIMSTIFRKPDQIIQPWQFGDGFSKRTCLWLKGCKQLKYTNIVSPGKVAFHGDARIPEWYSNRTIPRDITFPGIAKAMALQLAKE